MLSGASLSPLIGRTIARSILETLLHLTEVLTGLCRHSFFPGTLIHTESRSSLLNQPEHVLVSGNLSGVLKYGSLGFLSLFIRWVETTESSLIPPQNSALNTHKILPSKQEFRFSKSCALRRSFDSPYFCAHHLCLIS